MGLVLLAGCASGGNSNGEDDGTLTVTVSPPVGAAVRPAFLVEVYLNFAVFPAGADKSNIDNAVAAGAALMVANAATAQAPTFSARVGPTVWRGPGGTTFDVYVWKVANPGLSALAVPMVYSNNVSFVGNECTGPEPQTFTMDGDKLMEFDDRADFLPWSQQCR